MPYPVVVLTAALGLLVTAARGQAGGGFDLSWNRVGGGSAAPASGGGFALQGSLGQPTAGWRDDGSGLALVEGYGAIYGVHAFTLRLGLGWNLISVPLYPLQPDLADVLPAGVRGPLWEFAAEGYEPVLRAAPLQGYWVWSERATSRLVQGVGVEEPVRALVVGWSLVGPAGLPPYAALGLPLDCAPTGVLADSAWGWSSIVTGYRRDGLSLSVGAAYWVYAAVPAAVRLGP